MKIWTLILVAVFLASNDGCHFSSFTWCNVGSCLEITCFFLLNVKNKAQLERIWKNTVDFRLHKIQTCFSCCCRGFTSELLSRMSLPELNSLLIEVTTNVMKLRECKKVKEEPTGVSLPNGNTAKVPVPQQEKGTKKKKNVWRKSNSFVSGLWAEVSWRNKSFFFPPTKPKRDYWAAYRNAQRTCFCA